MVRPQRPLAALDELESDMRGQWVAGMRIPLVVITIRYVNTNAMNLHLVEIGRPVAPS